MRLVGMREMRLAVFVDLSAANVGAGEGGRSMHDVDERRPNHYEEALAALAEAVLLFCNDGGRVPLFAFAGKRARGRVVIISLEGGVDDDDDDDDHEDMGAAPCVGLDELIDAYRAHVPGMAPGATRSLVHVVRRAIRTVTEADSGGAPREMLIALVLTAGDSSGNVALSAALVDASQLPICFVVIGVGAGPFKDLARLDDELGQRLFDNVLFARLDDVKEGCEAAGAPLSVGLALATLAERPQAFAECRKLGYFDGRSAARAAARPQPPRRR